MSLLICLNGTFCSGKTTILQEFVDNPNVAIFDVKNFYIRERCIKKDGTMNWDRRQFVEAKLVKELTQFLHQSIDDKKLLIIESSGIGQAVNTVIRNQSTIPKTNIWLKTPSEEELTRRGEIRKENIANILSFSRIYETRTTAPADEELFPYEAAFYLRELVK